MEQHHRREGNTMIGHHAEELQLSPALREPLNNPAIMAH